MIRAGQNGARPARVLELGGDGFYIVELGGGEVPAYLSDQATDSAIDIGSVVTVLPMVGGFEIVSARTGPSGSGGIILGPELIANNGFESGALGALPDGWTALWDYTTGEPQPLSTSDDTPLAGSQVALVTVAPGAWTPNTTIFRAPSRIDPATVYRMSAYVSGRIASGTGVAVSLELVTAATEVACQYFNPDATVQMVASLSTPGEAWPLLSGDVTVPTGHTWFRPAFRVVADLGADLTVRWDSTSLRQRLT